jgi:hypothetical protein
VTSRIRTCYRMWQFALALVVPLVTVGPAPGQPPAKPKPHDQSTPPIDAQSADFLHSIGVCSAVSRRGESLAGTIRAARYIGLGWIRAGYESDIPVADLIEIHRRVGVRFSYGLASECAQARLQSQCVGPGGQLDVGSR